MHIISTAILEGKTEYIHIDVLKGLEGCLDYYRPRVSFAIQAFNYITFSRLAFENISLLLNDGYRALAISCRILLEKVCADLFKIRPPYTEDSEELPLKEDVWQPAQEEIKAALVQKHKTTGF